MNNHLNRMQAQQRMRQQNLHKQRSNASTKRTQAQAQASHKHMTNMRRQGMAELDRIRKQQQLQSDRLRQQQQQRDNRRHQQQLERMRNQQRSLWRLSALRRQGRQGVSDPAAPEDARETDLVTGSLEAAASTVQVRRSGRQLRYLLCAFLAACLLIATIVIVGSHAYRAAQSIRGSSAGSQNSLYHRHNHSRGSGAFPEVRVPRVKGDEANSAINLIENAGLNWGVTEKVSTTVPLGSVITSRPHPGETVRKGSNVDLVISCGVGINGQC